MKIHFIGIGGIGVSALAQYHLGKGDEVSGSDLVDSKIIEDMRKKGAAISVGPNSATNIKDCDLVIHSPAVKNNNPEIVEAERKGIKIMSYPQALGELTKSHKTIAVAGTHGKSTTTAMISLVLIEAGLDPTVIVGTKLKEFGDSNFRMGNSEYLVIEACEHEASFLNYWPEIIVVTNIEEDHLDYYGNLDNIKRAFNEFVSRLKKDGILVKTEGTEIETDRRTVNYSLNDSSDTEKLKKIIKIPGDHNVLDALAALKVARILNIDDEVSFSALSRYAGSWRRFEETELPGFILIDDYGHHPTEILATLKGAREKYPNKKIFCVFQPHQYQRTYLLFDDFVSAFKEVLDKKLVDKLFLIDIYDVAGRESKEAKEKVSSKKLAEAVPGATYVSKEDLFRELNGGEVMIFMGAGDIYDLSQELKEMNGYCS
ncbi:MAG: UDP-N-acetylmuramate--L-alanine ligase [Candidatus Pacebacteria bacterium]|nr:UDP-N-acetylmuramate--L-alanine ligase [Candidatus Paceibacterota bacterium]